MRCTPTATSRRSSSVSIALPMPRFRHAAARLIRTIHARPPLTVAAAVPASWSPTTATTAGSPARTAVIRSERPKTVPGPRPRDRPTAGSQRRDRRRGSRAPATAPSAQFVTTDVVARRLAERRIALAAHWRRANAVGSCISPGCPVLPPQPAVPLGGLPSRAATVNHANDRERAQKNRATESSFGLCVGQPCWPDHQARISRRFAFVLRSRCVTAVCLGSAAAGSSVRRLRSSDGAFQLVLLPGVAVT